MRFQSKGKQHRKKHKSRRTSRGSSDSDVALSADSLDLIYYHDYYDEARHTKIVAKRLKEKKEIEKAERDANKKPVVKSDTAIKSKSARRKTAASTRSAHVPKKSLRNVPASKQASPTTLQEKTHRSRSIRHLPPPSTNVVPHSSLSTSNLPKGADASAAQSEKIGQAASWHGGLSTDTHTQDHEDNSTLPSEQRHESASSIHGKETHHSTPQSSRINDLTRSEGSVVETHSPHKPRSVLTIQKPRRWESPSNGGSPKRQTSHIKHPNKIEQHIQEPSRDLSQDEQSRPKTTTVQASQPVKKKLVVRGLKNFVKTRKRDSFSSFGTTSRESFGSSGEWGERGKGSGPSIWKREFPSKGKFHPDNYIYDWPEGPKAPPRPFSAMAKCKKHGGRCNDCGLFTCDLCQSCRKCENDCACPCPTRGNQAYHSPYTPKEVYQEVFGGDGWNKACKVLCDLTEQEKKNPVGGNASKKQNWDENWAKNNFYKPQIDVLNPYNIPMSNVPSPEVPMCPQLPFQQPYCVPPMLPMPFMPMMTMSPAPMMMPYYPQPCMGYDPCCAPSHCPYPPSDSFIPVSNY